MMYGASQFVRSPPPPPRPPPPPPAPPAAPRPPAAPPAPAGRSDRGMTFAPPRPDALVLAGAQIEPRDAAPSGTSCRRCSGSPGIDARLEAVAAADHPPVARADADAVDRARRPALRLVVLRAAAHVVERQRVVDRDAIELRDRQVVEVPPRLAFVPRLVRAAVVADQDVVACPSGRPRRRGSRRARRPRFGTPDHDWPPSRLHSRFVFADQIVSGRIGSTKISW